MAPISATKLASKLEISRSYLYYLKNIGDINVSVDEFGKPIWDTEIIEQVKIKRGNEKKNKKQLPYKTTEINNRRYLGNKYKLLPVIKEIIDGECEGINTVADVFAGTGAVASAYVD
ncbi:MAG: DNA adenine methylase, partial [Anaerovoracaceae bacterium]